MWNYPLPSYVPEPLAGHSLHELFDQEMRRVQEEWNRKASSPPS
jgi:hypothetical protein